VARAPDGRVALAAYRVQPEFFDDIERIGRGAAYYRGHGLVADIQRQYVWMLGTVLLIALVALAFAVSARLAREMSRPLGELSAALGRIAAGEWSARVHAAGAPEMRRLGEAFNAMAARLEEARDALQRAEREAAWRDVAQRLAHEFKNNLTPMSLSLYVLAREAEAAAAGTRAEARESLAALGRGVAHLTRLAGQFSQYARLPEPRLEPLDLAAIAKAAAAQPLDGAAVTLAGDAPVAVVGDSLLLTRAIHNLVLNACEAGNRNNPVEVVTRIEGDRAVLEVLDRGGGIPERLRDRLFQPYVSTKQRGSGLGLALVRDIAEQHGGVVTLENRPGGGVVARLVLPLAGGATPRARGESG